MSDLVYHNDNDYRAILIDLSDVVDLHVMNYVDDYDVYVTIYGDQSYHLDDADDDDQVNVIENDHHERIYEKQNILLKMRGFVF